MAVLADLESLVADGVLTPLQAHQIRLRSGAAMVQLVTNLLLTGGILASAAGLVAWLAAPLPVALVGFCFLALGLMILLFGRPDFRMLGHAAALIGAGLLIGGAIVKGREILSLGELGWAMAAGGGLLLLPFGASYAYGPIKARFLAGFLVAAGLGLHLAGLYIGFAESGIGGLPRLGLHLYMTALLLGAGWWLGLRVLTALAVVPFAQLLDLSNTSFDALFAIFPEEPTLILLQMALAMWAALWLLRRGPMSARSEAQVLTFATMCFVVLNICFLFGSISGDYVGSSFAFAQNDGQFEASAWHIHRDVFAILWLIVLIVVAVLAARQLHRGIFNTTVTFATLHVYVQAFDRFGDQPLAWVIGGLLAIPLAWAIWRLNQQFG